VVLEHTGNSNDFPVAYVLQVSDDRTTWRDVQTGHGSPVATTIRLPAATRARYLRIVETGSSGAYWFSVNELRVFND
jgi:hypothetical protein